MGQGQRLVLPPSLFGGIGNDTQDHDPYGQVLYNFYAPSHLQVFFNFEA